MSDEPGSHLVGLSNILPYKAAPFLVLSHSGKWLTTSFYDTEETWWSPSSREARYLDSDRTASEHTVPMTSTYPVQSLGSALPANFQNSQHIGKKSWAIIPQQALNTAGSHLLAKAVIWLVFWRECKFCEELPCKEPCLKGPCISMGSPWKVLSMGILQPTL